MNYLFRTFEDVFHCLIIKDLCCSLGQQLVYFIKLICICQELFSTFFKVERRRRDLNPRAAINDLLPFQGSPFSQLGYFSIVCLIHNQIFNSLSFERRGWDSNPRALSDKRFSRPPRYDRFDTSPCVNSNLGNSRNHLSFWLVSFAFLSLSLSDIRYYISSVSECQPLF